MNVVREINKINEAELRLGTTASWHDEYKDSAYVYVGGLHYDLTEGDVITIFSQYGEIMDINLPRDKETGKTRGFGFLMYQDQRSSILAVDNLNGAKVLEKTLRVDHVKNYKQGKIKNADGEWVEPEEQSLNAKPEVIGIDVASRSDGGSGDESSTSFGSIDPEDPMRDYLIAKRKEEREKEKARGKKSKKHKSKTSSKGKHKDETPEERHARKKAKKEARKEGKKSSVVKGVEDLLKSLGERPANRGGRGSRSRSRSRSRSPVTAPAHHRKRHDDRYDSRDDDDDRHHVREPERERDRRSRSPVRFRYRDNDDGSENGKPRRRYGRDDD